MEKCFNCSQRVIQNFTFIFLVGFVNPDLASYITFFIYPISFYFLFLCCWLSFQETLANIALKKASIAL